MDYGTLRNVEPGWDAKGLLRPLWQSYPGKRDGLAAAIGSTGSTLSAVNTGRQRLGLDLGQRIAEALEITIFDLGAPTNAQVAARSAAVLDRLDALEARLPPLEAALQDALRALDDLRQLQGDGE